MLWQSYEHHLLAATADDSSDLLEIHPKAVEGLDFFLRIEHWTYGQHFEIQTISLGTISSRSTRVARLDGIPRICGEKLSKSTAHTQQNQRYL